MPQQAIAYVPVRENLYGYNMIHAWLRVRLHACNVALAKTGCDTALSPNALLVARACHRCSCRVRSTAPLYWIVTASNGGAVMAAAARLGGSLCHS